MGSVIPWIVPLGKSSPEMIDFPKKIMGLSGFKQKITNSQSFDPLSAEKITQGLDLEIGYPKT